MHLHGLLSCYSLLLVVAVEGAAQEVVSAQSGVIHYLEGAVSVDGKRVERSPAAFPLLKEGAVMATEKGRAELLLTHGTFLRLDENSSVKMVSAALTATIVEVLHGSTILDAVAAQGDIPLTLRYQDASVRFEKPGIYRIDSDTGVLQAYSGEAVVSQQSRDKRVDNSRLYFFDLGTDTNKFSDGADDEFYDWARNRNQVIQEENQLATADAGDIGDDNVDLGSVPLFNYNVPYGGVTASPGFPTLGSTNYPYSYLNSYLYSPFWTLPPLPAPAFIIGRRWAHVPGYTHSPGSAIWSTHHPSAGVTNTWLATHGAGTYQHPIQHAPIYTHVGAGVIPRPGYIHPGVGTPHVGVAPGTAPAHIGVAPGAAHIRGR
jgi:hypothetical protein